MRYHVKSASSPFEFYTVLVQYLRYLREAPYLRYSLNLLYPGIQDIIEITRIVGRFMSGKEAVARQRTTTPRGPGAPDHASAHQTT